MHRNLKKIDLLLKRRYRRSKQLRYTVKRITGYWEFWDSIAIWLEEEMGPINEKWTYVWDQNIYYIKFEHEEDKVKFILRWM